MPFVISYSDEFNIDFRPKDTMAQRVAMAKQLRDGKRDRRSMAKIIRGRGSRGITAHRCPPS